MGVYVFIAGRYKDVFLTSHVSNAGIVFILSVCVSLWSNVVLETRTVVGTTTEEDLSSLLSVYVCLQTDTVTVIASQPFMQNVVM